MPQLLRGHRTFGAPANFRFIPLVYSVVEGFAVFEPKKGVPF